MIEKRRDWNKYNTKLVDRGRTSTYLANPIARQGKDLIEINKDKVGHPFEYSFMLILGAFAIKSVDKKGYRQASGTVSDYLAEKRIYSSPNFRTINWRVLQLEKNGIKLMIYQSINEETEDIDVLIDSTGERTHKDGDYRSKMYKKIKSWKQMHIVISRKTRKILNMKVTREHAGDPNQFVSLIEPIVERRLVHSARADGAYDSNEIFEFCGKNNIDPIIPVRITSIGKKSNKFRKHAVEEQFGFKRRSHAHRKYWYPNRKFRRLSQDRWKKRTKYNDRSLIETANSVFKGVFDESVFSKTAKMIEKELLLKAVIYNKFIV